MKYRKKPLVVEAVRNFPQNLMAIGKMGCAYGQGPGDCLAIHTLEGVMIASPGDYIVKGIKDEFYPVKPEIFEASYEAIEE